MSSFTPEPSPAAYAYPLLIRQLLHSPLVYAGAQEIVSPDGTHAEGGRYDYRRLRERIARLASALDGLGVRPGNTVAVMDWDSHRYLECFFAVPMLGAVLHTINVRLSADQILYTVNHAEDDVLLVHEDFLPLLDAIRDRIENPPRLVLLSDRGDRAQQPAGFAGEYEALLDAGDPRWRFEDFDENTRATTFYTTGTTGLPKGVHYSHRQLVLHTLGQLACTCSGSGHGRFHKDDVYMPITPMFHVHAWGFPYAATLLGVKQVYPGRYEPEKLLGLITREKVTFSHCVPTILHMLLSSPAAADTDLSGWKVIVGGSAMPQGLARRALELGIDVLSGYGMSETGPVLTLAQLDATMLRGGPDEQVPIRCKTGRPSPLVDLRVVDGEMNDLPHDGESTGEVVVRAPWLTQSYLKDPERSDALWRGGYLHTGDIGYVDSRGYLKVTDRLKDVIKSGGEWISSLELEDLVSRCQGVAETAAIGIPDPRWGERPLVLVVAAPGSGVDDAAVKAHLEGFAARGELPRWAIPERVLLVETIEKTSVGKIDKKLLREKYAEK